MLGTQDEDVGLYAHRLQFLDGMLGGLGLEFLGCREEGDVCQVDTQCVTAQFPLHLADGLQIWQRLDVAHRAADLGDDEIIFILVAEQLDVSLDFVGDVRDDLYCLAEVITAPFLVDDAFIDASGGYVVGTGRLDAEETFVMSEVEVGFMPVYRHIALAVLIRIERAGVDIDIGVKLLYRDLVSPRLQQFAD